MRQLLPSDHEVEDLPALLGLDDRTPPTGRPWVLANMVMSIDGAIAVDGRSGGLGGQPDRQMFTAVRSVPDVVLVGAGTARTERYRRPGPGPAAELRTGRGQTAAPLLAVVSNRALVPEDQPFLSGEGPDPLLFHPATADVRELPPGVEPVVAGPAQVDLAEVLRLLAGRGARTVLCEGGPQLLGDLHAADLVDEYFVTVSPQAVGGDQVGVLGGTPAHVRGLRLHRLLAEDDVVLGTWRRER
ncbi:MAG: dihydrofolate reductase family protein [Actinomycetes bacterium]